MRRLLLILTLILSSSLVSAKPITRQEAMKIAAKKMKTLNREGVVLTDVNLADEIKVREGPISDAAPAFYTFSSDNNEGFVIVAGDDLFPEILAYSPTESIAQGSEGIPCCLEAFLEDYTRYVEAVREGKASAPAKSQSRNAVTPIVNKLVSAEWDQDKPYNAQCPSNSSLGQSIVGCVATAIAQILYTWKWPETGRGNVSYSSKYGALNVNFASSTYNWSVMKDKYSVLDVKKESGKAVAKLSYDCGLSVYMRYGESGSGTHTEYALKSLYQNFKYKASTLKYMHRDCCNNLNEFLGVIKREFNAGRPVLMSAVSSSGSGRDSGGHAFVIDGYDSDDNIHVNWGWSGSYNGFYDISVMDGGGYTFNSDQTIIYGIMPDYDDNDSQNPQQYRMTLQGKPRVSINSIEVGKDFDVKIDTLFNMFPFGNTYYVGVGLYDYNGQLQKVISTSTPREFLPEWKGYWDYDDLTCKVPTGFTGGYFIRVICRQDGFTDWILPDMVGGSDLNVIPVLIENGKVYFNSYPTGINDISPDAELVDVEYFTVGGQKISDVSSSKGVIIERRTFSNGTSRTAKRWVK